MARTEKDVVSYFPHDADASTGDTLTVLQGRYGNNGYAFWFKLLEKLASTDGHFLDVSNPPKWQIFIAKMGVDEITTVEIMNILVEMEAIDKDLWCSKVIWCQKLVDNVADVYKNRRRETPRKPISTNSKEITTGRNGITTGQSTQRKGKETKLNNIRICSNGFDTFWEAYPKKRAKGKTEIAFKKINPDEQLLSVILEAIGKAKKSIDWQKDAGQYIPYPASWLNGKRWEDEIQENPKPKASTGADGWPK